MSDWPEPELVGVDKPSVDESTVKGGGLRPRTLAVLSLLAILSFFSMRAFADPAAIEDVGQDAEAPAEEGADEVAVDRETPDETSGDELTVPTTTEKPDRTTTTRPPDPSRVVVGEPVFDHETGWDLLIGGETNMSLLSVDGGSTIDFETRGTPVGVVGDFIVFAGPSSGALRYVRLDAIDGKSQLAGPSDWYGWWGDNLIRGDSDAQFWYRSGDFDSPTWTLLDLSGPEATIVREVAAPANGTTAHPLIMSTPSGGLFVGTEDDLERVAEGNLRAVTYEYVIVEQCKTPFDCPLVWLDRDSFKPRTDIVVPPSGGGIDYWGIRVSPDGTHALLFTRDGRNIMWNLKTGEESVESSFSGEAFAFSPDSRYAAGMNQNNRLEIIDLQTGESKNWSRIARTSGLSSTVFVPSNTVAQNP